MGGRTGGEAWLKAEHGLSVDQLVSTARAALMEPLPAGA